MSWAISTRPWLEVWIGVPATAQKSSPWWMLRVLPFYVCGVSSGVAKAAFLISRSSAIRVNTALGGETNFGGTVKRPVR